ncbi:sensor histidine kinase [Phytohabitans sp. LJ34]|uniref:sensor histidine kinase n=1 Tax=Phytohabitans sp. LJ34 TaxID=3452217 RepID=UPI003F8A5BED
MGRHLLAAAVVAADTAILAAGHPGLAWLGLLLAAAALLTYRLPVAGLAAALVLNAVTGVAYLLMLWTAFRAGRAIGGRRDAVAAVGAAAGGLALLLAVRPADPRAIPQLVVLHLVFVALPLLVGGYLAQQERLTAALADQARLGERLRIARDMHDSVGRRLSLVSMQAAALEVTALPPAQSDAVRRLAATAREAMDEVYGVVGALRDTPDLAALVAQFRAAGVPVELRERGVARPLPEAAYRVVEEGLTNAAKHAPSRPVTVELAWQRRALRVMLTNPGPAGSATTAGAGRGLPGLTERVRLAGGRLQHGPVDGVFQLSAALPLQSPPAPAIRRPLLVGAAAAALLFLVLPATMMLGVA